MRTNFSTQLAGKKAKVLIFLLHKIMELYNTDSDYK